VRTAKGREWLYVDPPASFSAMGAIKIYIDEALVHDYGTRPA